MFDNLRDVFHCNLFPLDLSILEGRYMRWWKYVFSVCYPPETCKFGSLWKGVFADVSRLRILRRDHPGLDWALIQRPVPLEERRGDNAEKEIQN